MAVQLDQSGKDDLKTQFITREGTYSLVVSEFSRPNRVNYQSNQGNPQVRVSLCTLPTSELSAPCTNGSEIFSGGSATSTGGDRICFNLGKELYVYAFRGCKRIPTVDMGKPLDKKLYKGTNPSCHDFNQSVAVPDGAPLLVGFTTGQIQLVQPGKREQGRLFNEDRFIDKTKVTCLKWLPNSPNLFLASHSSGHLYLYNEELPCTPSAPSYQNFKSCDGFKIDVCKSKSTRNPLYKWTFSNDPNCCINEFCFSPCGLMLAIVSQDGFLRVFNYDKMELMGVARSYFGGFLCVCWSPDGKYIVVGGEDDLVTVWSLHERRVVARGQGHRSWVSVVAFDPFTTFPTWDGPDFSDDENPINDSYRCYNNHKDIDTESIPPMGKRSTSSCRDSAILPDKLGNCYRLGSVSQDTQLCLWDITEDTLRQSYEIRQRLGSHDPQVNGECSGQVYCNDIKVINPTASGSGMMGINKDAVDSSSKNSSNSSSKSGSKFATANCTSGSESGRSSVNENISKHFSSTNKTTSNSISGRASVTGNCVNVSSSVGKNENSPIDAGKSTNASKSSDTVGQTAFNSITQRLSNFSFGNDKKSSSSGDGNHGHKKTFTFSKSTGNHTGFMHNHNSATADNSTSSVKNSKFSSNSIVPTYDPMAVIGTSVCPRFDECPLLEPLVCKKIAHERLTALIFREDCFLTACQDGIIYTWARPGFSSMSQHMSSSPPSSTPGGTVV
ncbi:WD repeat-containing protein 20 [Bradysia coprophila]|uniref:WD repeat-containing protein 20 n=1 Tax=Bradysia coprophila TaxID=38358 RepID=UPI00187D7C17|nr:WD repeat-containing protein 20 [Bradysia coprophila]